MRKFRVAAMATSLSLLGAATTMGSASAAASGVGTSKVTTTVAELAAGNGLLSVKALVDESASTIDKTVANPSAGTSLAPLTIASNKVAALNLAVPSVTVQSTGAEDKKSVPATNLAGLVPTSVLPVGNGLLAGTLDAASLNALVDTTGARSGLTSTLSNFSAVAGLASVKSVTAQLGTSASTPNSDSTRGFIVDDLRVGSLGGLLDSLGISLDVLPLSTLTGVANQAALFGAGGSLANALSTAGAPGVTSEAQYNAAVASIKGAIANDNATITALSDPLCTNLAALQVTNAALFTSGTVLNDLGLPGTTTCAAALTAVQGVRAADQGDLLDVVNALLAAVDGLSLVRVAGLEVGLSSKATDTVANSVARVTAKMGPISVGNLTVPGFDAIPAAAQVTSTATSVANNVNGILAKVDPSLGNLVSVKLLDTSGTGVTLAGKYVQSLAQLTAVNVGINPPATLSALVSGLALPAAPASVLEDLTAAGIAAPALTIPQAVKANAIDTLLGAQALGGGGTVKVLGVSATSNFLAAAPGGSSSPSGTLPRTGANTTLLAGLAMLLVAAALGIRRRVLAPVRIDK